MQGEDPNALPNLRPRWFNDSVKALADELSLAYLPMYEIMEQVLRTQQQQRGHAFEESKAGGLMMRTLWDHNIRGRSWDDISARSSLVLMTDTIHFNSRGADIIADLIESWLYPLAV